MVSRLRKMRPARKFERTDGGTMLKTARKEIKRENEDRNVRKKYEREYARFSKSLGTKFIENKPPHRWICQCGHLNYGRVESKVDNAVIVRCSSCEGSGVRVIKA